MSNYICRTCLTKCDSEQSAILTNSIIEMLEFCVPEFDITVINNPVICGQCHDLLKKLYAFRLNCIDVQKQILNLSVNVCGDGFPNGLVLNSPKRSRSSKEEEGMPVLQREYKKTKIEPDEDITRLVTVLGSPLMEDHNNDEFIQMLDSSNNVKRESKEVFSNFYDDSEYDSSEEFNGQKKTAKNGQRKKPALPKIKLKSDQNGNTNSTDFVMVCQEPRCPYEGSYRDMQSHVVEIHPDYYHKYHCVICKYKAAHKKDLVHHFTTNHSGARNLKSNCIICTKNYSHLKDLKKHIKTIHPTILSDNNVFTCDMCPLRTINFDEFRSHYLTEHGLSCNVCKMEFSVQRVLNLHVKTHYDQRSE